MTSTFDLAAEQAGAVAPAEAPGQVTTAAAAQVGSAPSHLPGWWPVALTADVTDKPVAVRLLDQELALYRDGSGVVRAVDDMCPHRRLPLSMGRITDGDIQCGYHGWTFNGETGACSRIPNLSAKERPSPRIKLPVFGTAEQDGLVLVTLTGQQPLPLQPAGAPAASYSFVARSPHAELVRALAWNPGRVTGLGLALGEGEQDTDPSCNRSPGQVVVTRSRQTLPLRRLGTYGHVVDHRTTTEVRVPADGGVVEVTCQHAVLGGSVRVLVGLQPLTSHTTRLHVAARVQGPPAAVVALRGALRLATLTSRRGSRAATRAEAVADETLRRRDAELTAVSTLRSHLAEGADL